MPGIEDHQRLAERNHDTLIDLKKDLVKNVEWVATVAFYEALHWVEMIMACDGLPDGERARDHDTREEILKTPKYRTLYGPYIKLYDASMVARYMHKGRISFIKYLPAANVEPQLINGSLAGIRKEAGSRLARRTREAAEAAAKAPPAA